MSECDRQEAHEEYFLMRVTDPALRETLQKTLSSASAGRQAAVQLSLDLDCDSKTGVAIVRSGATESAGKGAAAASDEGRYFPCHMVQLPTKVHLTVATSRVRSSNKSCGAQAAEESESAEERVVAGDVSQLIVVQNAGGSELTSVRADGVTSPTQGFRDRQSAFLQQYYELTAEELGALRGAFEEAKALPAEDRDRDLSDRSALSAVAIDGAYEYEFLF